MKVIDMPTLYLSSLQDLYSAELQIAAAMPKMIDAATSLELQQMLRIHFKETERHVMLLEKILVDLQAHLGGHECLAMERLLLDSDEIIQDVTDPEVSDLALIGAAQKVEHYEISCYYTARIVARLLGREDHAVVLEAILEEEYDADEKLADMADAMVEANAVFINVDLTDSLTANIGVY